MCSMRSFFSWVCCGREWRVAFLRSTSAKHKLPPTFTSGGRSHDGPGISFKSTWMVASSFSSSTIILWRITQANTTLPTPLRFHNRAGRRMMVKRDCSTPKARSTSFLAPSCCLAKTRIAVKIQINSYYSSKHYRLPKKKLA